MFLKSKKGNKKEHYNKNYRVYYNVYCGVCTTGGTTEVITIISYFG
jgi:hypothetical protein